MNSLVNSRVDVIGFVKHAETMESKAHVDILFDGVYVGYYVIDSLCVYIEYNMEVYTGRFGGVRMLRRGIRLFALSVSS